MHIRAAEKNDINRLAELRHTLWPGDLDEHNQELVTFFQGGHRTISQVFVAAIDCALLGFIELNIRTYAEGSLANRVPYVEGWYVVPHKRGCGIGRALMQSAESWALGNGFDELASDTELSNCAGQAAHSQLGFIEVDTVVCYIKKLSD